MENIWSGTNETVEKSNIVRSCTVFIFDLILSLDQITEHDVSGRGAYINEQNAY